MTFGLDAHLRKHLRAAAPPVEMSGVVLASFLERAGAPRNDTHERGFGPSTASIGVDRPDDFDARLDDLDEHQPAGARRGKHLTGRCQRGSAPS